MSVYVDSMRASYGRMVMCHMLADTTEELLAMADEIGVARRWIQDAGTKHEHFDIALSKRRLAVKAGAIEIEPDQLADLLRARNLSEVLASHEGALPPGVDPNVPPVRSPDEQAPMSVRRWWLSSNSMTIEIETTGERITKAPPIAKRFIGQPSKNLVGWMNRQGGLRITEMTT